jgi:hypothetical protein
LLLLFFVIGAVGFICSEVLQKLTDLLCADWHGLGVTSSYCCCVCEVWVVLVDVMILIFGFWLIPATPSIVHNQRAFSRQQQHTVLSTAAHVGSTVVDQQCDTCNI